MSIHGVIDQLATGLGSLFMRKYFRDGCHSDSVKEHLEQVKLNFPGVEGEGEYQVIASTKVGELNAAFRLVQWLGSEYPTAIYHHGAAETPCDYGFKNIFPYKKEKIEANLFLVQAPFHGSMKEFQQGICTLENVVAMLAVSIRLIEELVQENRRRGVDRVLIAGTSLGGFITNLHHIHYNSADVYTPLLAGLVMNDAYLRSVYSKAVSPEAKENADSIEKVLDFRSDFAACDNSNVFPLLAVHDRIIRFAEQKSSYGDVAVETIDKGHTTGALAYKELRQHILKRL